MILTEDAPVNHPTIDLGCGSLCQINYDSVISSAIAIVVTIAVAIVIATVAATRIGPTACRRSPNGCSRTSGGLPPRTRPTRRTFVVPLAATIGFYILIANYLDFLPITLIPNVHPANTDVNQTAAMAIVVFLVVNAYTIRLRGVHGLPEPPDATARAAWFGLARCSRILNVIEEIAKPATLALRLFGNLLAGLLMIYVITLLLGNLPYVGSWLLGPIFLAIWKLFDVLFIGLIQAFIFMLLTMVYFGLAREGLRRTTLTLRRSAWITLQPP